MKFLKSLLMGTGAVVLAGLVLALLVPKAVHAVAATAVQVVNTPASPAIVSSMNDPGRIAYQSTSTGPEIGGGAAAFGFGPIPSNHRLVVQHVAFNLNYSSSSTPSQVAASYAVGQGSQPVGGIASVPVSSFNGSPFLNGITFDAPAQFYVDQGNYFSVYVFINGYFSTLPQQVTVVGYMLDCAAAPCSAVAQ